MSWREYVASSDTFGFCDCCTTQNFDEDGYYVATIGSWFCKTCFNAYYDTAVHYSVDSIKERQKYNEMVEKLKDLGTWENG